MKTKNEIGLDFIVDKLTNSIQNTISGDSFQTEILRFTLQDSRKIISKKDKWNFDWSTELKDNKKEVYKLTIVNNSDVIQGLLSISIENDYVFVHLLENAPFNIGKHKIYEGVAGNLIAYACKLSFQHGFDGFVSFISKTKLIEHYESTLGAYRLGGARMIIPTDAASSLVEKYFKM
jgi:hypothetical protein